MRDSRGSLAWVAGEPCVYVWGCGLLVLDDFDYLLAGLEEVYAGG